MTSEREEKLFRLYQLSEQTGDIETEVAALRMLKEIRTGQPSAPSLSSQQPQVFPDAQSLAQETLSPVGQALGAAETLGTIASSVVAEPLAGIAGIISSPLGSERAARAVEETRRALTYDPKTEEGQANIRALGKVLEPLAQGLESLETELGDQGYEIAGPIGGAIGASLPTAALEVIGLVAPKAAARFAKKKAAKLQAEIPNVSEGATVTKDELIKSVQAGKPEDIAIAADIDPEFIKAMDELDISTEPLASFAAKNKQFVEIEQGLASIPGSKLSNQSKAFISELSRKADDLVEQYGGTLDKADLSQRFKDDLVNTVENLESESSKLYNLADQSIDQTVKVTPQKTINFIEGEIKRLGGEQNLEGPVKQLYKSLVDQKPTYGLLKDTRQQIGRGFKQNSGPFADADQGRLKKLYSILREDQDIALDAQGVKDQVKSADALVVERKKIEDQMIDLLGKDLSNSITKKAGERIKALTKGDINKFTSFLEKVPDRYRQEVVVSSLNDVFRGTGAQQQAFNANNFVKFMDELNRNKAAKNEIFKYLPTDGKKMLDNMYKVSKGVSQAAGQRITTGRVASLFEDQRGLLKRLMGDTAAFTMEKTLQLSGKPIVAQAVKRAMGGKDNVANIGDLLGSSEFQSMLTQAVRDGVLEGKKASKLAEKSARALEKTEKYKRWAESLPESSKAKLGSLGTVNYLFVVDKDEEETE